MADYGNGMNPNTGQNFQPPVPDTTFGPIQHVFKPPRRGGNPQPVQTGFPMGAAMPGAPVVCGQPMAYSHPMAPGQTPFGVGAQAAQGANAGGPTYMGANTQGNIILQPGQPPMMLQPGQQPQPGVQYFAPGMPGQQGYPAVMNTPGMPQPTGNFVIGGGMNQNLWANAGAGAPGGFPGAPDIMGIGRTGAEHNADILNAMHTEGLLEPQEMVPKDDDPSRMYLLRELDGNWTKRNRFTLNRLAVRWLVFTLITHHLSMKRLCKREHYNSALRLVFVFMLFTLGISEPF
ncbi:hypothetical protein BJ166DRAFT_615811 [Pestalotiopsis sp. NC0098]|nr:hypothetical protein BJ166DRAFT_615811 [Pestalotiopsis sp. NC0098]